MTGAPSPGAAGRQPYRRHRRRGNDEQVIALPLREELYAEAVLRADADLSAAIDAVLDRLDAQPAETAHG
jgi:hypothetical protein